MSVLLSVQGIEKQFGPRPLFTNLSLDLRAGERIGLIGPNGAGKSTLLKILAGTEPSDEGTRSVRRGCRVGVLAQDDRFPVGHSARQVLLDTLARDVDEHEREVEVNIVLSQVGFEDGEILADTMSGGWRKRLALARELVKKPDFLILDEPTNHLDLPGVLWLQQLLRGASFGYLVATHDRAFLRAVADEIIELNRVYPEGYFRSVGNFDTFAERKELFLEAQAKREESVANRVRVETEWLAHKARARTRKASSRIEEAAKRREELAELKYRNATATAAGIDFVATGRQSRKLLQATGLAKSLGGKTLFTNVDFVLAPGTKLGLLGANGSGKSTLMKLVSAELEPDAGTIERAPGLRVVMFEQGRAGLDLSLTLKEALCPNGEMVTYGERTLHVAAWAKQFLFQPEQLNGTIRELSGGEQSRVRIAQLMLQPADILLLDEPTNDLDIPSLEVLEDSLTDFPGAVVIVSHDRELLDRLCTEVIGLDGNGVAGNFRTVGQWLEAYQESISPATRSSKSTAATAKPKDAAPKASKVKLSYKEKQELDGMETTILEAEELVNTRQQAVEQAATAGHVALTEACRLLEEAQGQVTKLYARWQELEAKKNAS